MEFQLEPAIEILRRTPATLRTLLEGLSEPWVLNNEGIDTWSPHDLLGHLIHGEIIYDLRGQFSAKSTFKYDANGDQTESEYYGPNGLMWVRRYDSQGNEAEVAKYDGGGCIEYREENIFDEKGNNIESLTYNGDGLLKKRERTSYEYDQKGNWIKAVSMDCIAENDNLPCKSYEVFYSFITYY